MIKIAYSNNGLITVRSYKFGAYLKHAHVYVGAEPYWKLLNENNYFEVSEDPTYDPIMQYLGAYEIVENKAIRTVINKTFGTIEDEKKKKIKEVKQKCYDLMQPTDWYDLRFLKRGIEIPEEIQQERDLHISECNRKEAEINALTELREVVGYE